MEPEGNWRASAGPFLTLGMQLAVGVVVFLFLGRWLDGKFDTGPWLTIAGAVLGIAGGFISFFRTAIRLGREQDAEAKERRAHHES